MFKKSIALIAILTAFYANAENMPKAKHKHIKDNIEECFGKYLRTKDENPMNVAYRTAGASKVSPEKAKEQEASLKIVLKNIMESAPYKKAVDKCCNKIFNGLDKYDAKDILKTINYYVDIKDLQPLCPTQVDELVAKAK